MFKPRPSPFIAEFTHTQLHSARARDIADRINGEGLGSEARLASFPGSPSSVRTIILRVTFDPPAQKSEGEPGSKYHVNDVASR